MFELFLLKSCGQKSPGIIKESDPEAQTGPGLGSTPALMTLFGEGEPRAQGIRQDGRYSARNGRIELRQGSLY